MTRTFRSRTYHIIPRVYVSCGCVETSLYIVAMIYRSTCANVPVEHARVCDWLAGGTGLSLARMPLALSFRTLALFSHSRRVSLRRYHADRYITFCKVPRIAVCRWAEWGWRTPVLYLSMYVLQNECRATWDSRETDRVTTEKFEYLRYAWTFCDFE